MTGVVLAGGKSRRIGTNKALLPFEGSTLLGRAVEVLHSVAEKVWVIVDSAEGCYSLEAAVKQNFVQTVGVLGESIPA